MDPLTRPIIVVAPPRSGARLIAQALAATPGTWSLNGRGAMLGGAPELDPPDGARSGRLRASDCQPAVRERISSYLRTHSPTARSDGRLFDASPRNALRVPFLDALFPDATFVFVRRRPADALAESLVTWRAGSAATYPALPRWQGPTWSFLLVPGWQQLIGRPLAEVVTAQWVTTMRTVLTDLEQLPSSRWCVTDHDALMKRPGPELERLLDFLGLDRSAAGAAVLELAPSRLAAPVARSAREELGPYLARANELDDQALDWIAPHDGHVSDKPT